MIKIAITGGIASGKSTILKYFKELGCAVFSSDEEIGRIYADRNFGNKIEEILLGKGVKNVDLQEGLVKRCIKLFNKVFKIEDKNIGDLYMTDGSIDRKVVADIIFNDSAKKRKLEMFLYQKLQERRMDFLRRNWSRKIVAFEVPLLFEKNLQHKYDFIISAYCSPFNQKRNFYKRCGAENAVNRKIFCVIKNHQMPNDIKKSMSNCVICTDKSKFLIKQKAKSVITKCK